MTGNLARRLIVSADDFGVDVRVNEAVEIAATEGILTSASLMVGGDAADDAITRAWRLPSLAVGLHLTLADGRPVLSPARIPALVGRDGRFRDGLFGAGMRWFFSPEARRQLKAEIHAQFKAFAKTGLVLDHVNAHKHLHLHPTIGELVAEIGGSYGLHAMRIPAEPRRIVAKADPAQRPPRTFLAPVLTILRSKAAHLITNDRVFGLAWSGAVTEERLLGLIPLLPPGLNELYTHPATADAGAMAHAVPGYHYREELAALTSPRVKAALAAHDIRLERFSALVPEPRPAVADGGHPTARA